MIKDLMQSAPVQTAIYGVASAAILYAASVVKKFIDDHITQKFRLKFDERERSIGLITNLVEFAVSEGAQVLSGLKRADQPVGDGGKTIRRNIDVTQRNKYAKQAALNVMRSAVGNIVEEKVKMPSKGADGKEKVIPQRKFIPHPEATLDRTLGVLGKYVGEDFAHHVIEAALHKPADVTIPSIIRGMLINK